VKLRYHTIVRGRYYRAGEDVPDEDVSPRLAKYAVSEDGDAADLPGPQTQKARRYVVHRAKSKFKKVK
jgi:hypothetical protein